MEHGFWHERWQRGQIAFHEGTTNQRLSACFHELACAPGSRVFVPLCGKTRDIAWLLGHGYHVVGAELSPLAVEELFRELDVEPAVSDDGRVLHHSDPDLRVHVGDIFDLTPDTLGPVDAVYDRAAFVALPADLRARYVDHLVRLTGAAPQLLVTMDYDQALMSGPPFSIDEAEVRARYSDRYDIRGVDDAEMPGGLKGVPAREQAWLLDPR
ncbi:MAG: thiopurine S-methyltransferase [Thermoleophilia bacterium]